MTRLTSLDLNPFYRNTVGIDRLMDRMLNQIDSGSSQNYPPFNLIQVDDDNYVIEVAVAGFGKDDINITEHDGALEISGEKVTEENEDTPKYHHQGISSRRFTRSFNLADHVKVTGADMKDGILTVSLQREVPEEMKPKTIAINHVS